MSEKPLLVIVGSGPVLIADHVKKGTFYDPDRIADVYWELYNKKDRMEYLFKE